MLRLFARELVFLFSVFFGLHPFAAYAFTVSGDSEYFVSEAPGYQFIYSAEYRPFIAALIADNEKLRGQYQAEFNWKLDEKATLVLASPRNQIANGFATLFPNLDTVFYGGGAEVTDQFAIQSWSKVLLNHETAHLYQLDTKRDYSKFLHQYLGNPLPSVAPPFTYMMVPNLFLPTFILEGNATFNEGRFQNGGRLYSGEYRAIVFQLLNANEVNSTRLINDHLKWPYGQEKYLVGGYFQLFLAETYGIEKTNRFFWNNSAAFVNPFLLKKAFLETFGISYDQAVQDFNSRFGSLAKNARTIGGAPLAKSISHTGFGRNPADGSVSFLTSDGKNRPQYHEVKRSAPDSAEKELQFEHKSRGVNIPPSEPLYARGKLVTASSESVKYNQIRYGLFEEGYKPQKNTLDHLVYDIHENKKVYAFIPESFVEPKLYESNLDNTDRKNLGPAHSSAHYSRSGDLYFFRQNGPTRTLYKNGSAVASFEGYYGKIADVTADGTVYFISNTDRGSGLFRFVGSSNTIERVHPADTLVDARELGDGKWMGAEVTSKGYEYRTFEIADVTAESPAVYRYFYESSQNGEGSSLVTSNSSLPVAPIAAPALTERPYSSWRSIRFNGLDPLIAGYTEYGPIWGLGVRFSDPLQYNNFSLSYAMLEGATNDVFFQYTNRKNRLNWTFAVGFDQSAIFDLDTSDPDARVIARYETWEGALQLELPLLVRPQSTLALTTRYNYEYDDSDDNVVLDREQSVLSYLEWTRSRNYAVAFDSSEAHQLVIAHEAVGDIPKWRGDRNRYAALYNTSWDVFRETYLSAGYHAVRSDSPQGDIEIDRASASGLSTGLFKPTELERFSQDTSLEYAEAHKAFGSLKQAINVSAYFKRFPVALRRFAPFVTYQEFYTRNKNESSLSTLFHEWAYGAEFELLLAHKFPVRFSALRVEMNRREGTALTTFIHLNQSF